MEEHWGPAPGEMFVDRSANPEGDIVLAALRRGNLLILIQPPRGFGENPIAIYHDPDLPPSHHYLAAYRWIAASAEENGFGADAMIHLGKHGNLEWLPGKNAGLSAACGPDAALGDLPLVYPFLVNDPGEGTQAKRRVHATLIDHLVPPMARADSYGDIARLEQLLDEHAQIAAMDPAKLHDPRPDLDADPGGEARPRPRGAGPPGGRGLRRLHHASRRVALRDQGRPDPRRPARAGQPARRERPGQPGPGRAPRPADLGRYGLAPRPARGARPGRVGRHPHRRRRDRGAGARPGPGDGRRGLGAGGRGDGGGGPSPSRGRHPHLRGHRGRPAHGGHDRRTRPRRPRVERRVRPGGPVRLPAAGPGQRAPHGPQLLLGGPEGGPLEAGVGDGSGAGRIPPHPLPHRQRRLAHLGRPLPLGHERDAHGGRRHRGGVRAARHPPRLGRRLAPGDGPGAHPLRGAGPPPAST